MLQISGLMMIIRWSTKSPDSWFLVKIIMLLIVPKRIVQSFNHTNFGNLTHTNFLWRAMMPNEKYPYAEVNMWLISSNYNRFHKKALRWRHNGHNCVSNHQHRHCLLNRLFERRSKKTSQLRVTGPVTRKMFPFDDVIMGVSQAWCTRSVFVMLLFVM